MGLRANAGARALTGGAVCQSRKEPENQEKMRLFSLSLTVLSSSFFKVTALSWLGCFLNHCALHITVLSRLPDSVVPGKQDDNTYLLHHREAPSLPSWLQLFRQPSCMLTSEEVPVCHSPPKLLLHAGLCAGLNAMKDSNLCSFPQILPFLQAPSHFTTLHC